MQLLGDLDSLVAALLPNHCTQDVVVKAANEPEIKGIEALKTVFLFLTVVQILRSSFSPQHFSGMFPHVLWQKHKILRVGYVKNILFPLWHLNRTYNLI
jgi:hypothetical protein